MTPPEVIALFFALQIIAILGVYRSSRRVNHAVERERMARRVRESGRKQWLRRVA